MSQWAFLIGYFGHHVDELAATKSSSNRPRLHGFDDSEKAGQGSTPRFYGVENLRGFSRVSFLEIGQAQVVLGREVCVESRFGHAGLFDDLIHAGGAIALPVKEVTGCFQNTFPGRYALLLRNNAEKIDITILKNQISSDENGYCKIKLENIGANELMVDYLEFKAN